MTRVMSCSTMTTATPASAIFRSSRPRLAVSFGPSPAAGFVEQQDGRADGERAGNLDEPLVDVGKSGRGLFHRACVSDEGEQRLGGGPRLGVTRLPARERRRDRAEAPSAKRNLEVLPHGQVLEELGRLVGASDAGARDGLGGAPGHVAVAEPHRTRLRSKIAADQVEGRRSCRRRSGR